MGIKALQQTLLHIAKMDTYGHLRTQASKLGLGRGKLPAIKNVESVSRTGMIDTRPKSEGRQPGVKVIVTRAYKKSLVNPALKLSAELESY